MEERINFKKYKVLVVVGLTALCLLLIGLNYGLLRFWDAALHKEAEEYGVPVNRVVEENTDLPNLHITNTDDK
jgi:hypothetical protein